jgi:hypothetical protein
MDRVALRTAITAGRLRLDRALGSFDEAAMLEAVDDGWTRKDVLAHLEAWERRVVDLLCALRTGEAIPEQDTDAANAAFLARDRERSLGDVRSGEREAYEALLAAIDGASDEELFDGRHFAWTGGDPFADWFRANGDEHFDEHLDQLTRATVSSR